MLPQILAMVIKGGPEGGKVDIGSWPFIVGSMPFIVVITLIVMLTRYHLVKKRLEHQQILAAIEKGTPLSELRPPVDKGPHWVRSLSIGVIFLLIGIGNLVIGTLSYISGYPDKDAGFGLFLASAVFLSLGGGGITCGILLRKADKALSSDKSALNANNGQ
jgi:hypothetical protein